MVRDPLWQVVRVLPTDYTDYGGSIERWRDPAEHYPDCSSGCRHFRRLISEHGQTEDADWGVCVNIRSRRVGLLTFEHQAGYQCWEGP